jgi:uncharacterized oligopeptide transporter (OPT) family protein
LSEEDLEKRMSEAKAKNRVALIWIIVACLILATLGFLYAVWLRGRPVGP